MKTQSFVLSIAVACLLSAAVWPAHADGRLHFAAGALPVRVYERDPFTADLTLVPTNGGKVELLYAPLGTTDLSLFRTVPGTAPVTIFPAPGTFVGGTYVIPDSEPAPVISAIVRGWTGLFESWSDAVNSGTAKLGISDIFLVATSNPHVVPIEPPASIINSVPGQGFNGLILAIPEPSSLSLVGLGAAALWQFRRR